MPKKKTVTMWGLWNFDTLREVGYYRKDVRAAANATCIGGKPDADKMFRRGAFKITKISVREL